MTMPMMLATVGASGLTALPSSLSGVPAVQFGGRGAASLVKMIDLSSSDIKATVEASAGG